jgi:hypothetical protein
MSMRIGHVHAILGYDHTMRSEVDSLARGYLSTLRVDPDDPAGVIRGPQ